MTASIAFAVGAAAIAAALAQPRSVAPHVVRLPRLALVAGVVGGALVALRPNQLPIGLVVAVDLLCLLRLVHAARRRRLAERRSREVLLLCDALAAELRAGLPVGTSVQRAAVDWPALRPVAEAARLGASVSDALRDLAREPGMSRLVNVAAAWQVSERSGAGLAATLRRTSEVIRADLRLAALVEVELGAARATGRLLAGLPVLALLLGSGLGVDAVGFFGTPAGVVSFAAGSALLILGMLWLERLANVETR